MVSLTDPSSRTRRDPAPLRPGAWLALELSTLAGSVALFDATGALLGERALPAQTRRTGALFPEITQLFREAHLSAEACAGVALSQGPGSFTGLRTACAIGRMFRSTLGAPLVAVPSFEVLAWAWQRQAGREAPDGGRIAVLRDARRGQVYAALVRWSRPAQVWRAETARCVELAAWLAAQQAVEAIVSDDPIQARGAPVALTGVQPRAADLARAAAVRIAVGEFSAPDEIVPLYVRPPECEEVYEAKRAAAMARRVGE